MDEGRLSRKPEGQAQDRRWKTLLDLMSVPEFSGVYVLGCFVPRSTFLSQQIRALNLVDALCKSGVLTTRSRAAVVGAGVAGLTAAAGLAVRGVPVDVFERGPDLMPLQRNSRQRVVHPHIYDWPIKRFDERTAGLPLLDWEVGEAEKVIRKIEEEWGKLPEGVRSKINCFMEGEARIQRPGVLSWNGSPGANYDAVILAVGFGLEEGTGTKSYWTDDDLDGVEAQTGTWLVSGAGDGGLTDLMRLCIQDFRHDTVLEAFASVATEKVGKNLLECDSKSWMNFEQAYRYAAKQVNLKIQLRNTQITWNADPATRFASGSSVLNRLIVAWLLEHKEIATLNGRIKIPVKTVQDGFEVTWEDGEIKKFDHVVVRHGPHKALAKYFPEIYEKSRDQKRIWESVGQGGDWTREPLWNFDEFVPGGPAVPPLTIQWGDEIGCVVLTAERGSKLPSYVELALIGLSKVLPNRVPGRVLNTKPSVIDLEEAVASPDRYARTLRALCSSEIAVLHLNGFDPVAMLLLGIRSVVRRGVTLTVIQERLDDAAWARLPFNLKEIKPLSLADGWHQFTQRLKAGIEEGFRRMLALPGSYLDLPSYDAVRNLGTERADFQPLSPTAQTLILCSFNGEYLKESGEFIRTTLGAALDNDDAAVRIVDTDSPQLVSQRLHEAIRRNQLCVIDWTEWRPNVFYEMGVRTAASKMPPLCLLRAADAESPGKVHPRAAALEALFVPFRYRDHEPAELMAVVHRHLQLLEGKNAASPNGLISPGMTYEVVRDAIDLAQQPGGTAVVEVLKNLADRMISKNFLDHMTSPALYEDNPELKQQVLRSALEHLLAAWYYLDQRHRLRERRPKKDDEHSRSYRNLGGKILDVLRAFDDGESQALAREIEGVLEDLDQPGEEAS